MDRLLFLIQFVRLAYLELRKVDDKGETNIIDVGLVLLILRDLFVQESEGTRIREALTE